MNRKIYKEIERFTQNEYMRIADILSIWKDIRIAYMNKLGEIGALISLYQSKKRLGEYDVIQDTYRKETRLFIS